MLWSELFKNGSYCFTITFPFTVAVIRVLVLSSRIISYLFQDCILFWVYLFCTISTYFECTFTFISLCHKLERAILIAETLSVRVWRFRPSIPGHLVPWSGLKWSNLVQSFIIPVLTPPDKLLNLRHVKEEEITAQSLTSSCVSHCFLIFVETLHYYIFVNIFCVCPLTSYFMALDFISSCLNIV